VERVFADTGILRLDGAFTAAQAAAMRDTIWRHVERRTGVRRDDPSTWSPGAPHLSFKSLKRNPVFGAVVANEAVTAALDGIFGAGGWAEPRPGAQVLVTLPSSGPWTLPAGRWHMDCGFERPTWPAFAVKLFAFVDDVAPEGGGTLLLSGSHRLVERYATTLPAGTGGNTVTWGRFMRQDPWLHDVYRGGRAGEPRRARVGVAHDVGGIPVEVVELTGRPGDVVVTHLHVFHCGAPAVGDRPRQMLGKAVMAAA
jgi:hypothetical protein